MTRPVAHGRAICSYEGTSYRANFWDGHGREYEDLAERIALRHLLPPGGKRLAEVGAGFGRLADLYSGYEQVLLLDYAQSGLREAQERLGRSGRFLFIAADLYHLPLAPSTCDTVVTVRVLHHVVDIPAALQAIAGSVRPGGVYVLEFANKRNLKAITRYLLRRQRWSPFAKEPVEFVELNFDFHPSWMEAQLRQAGFRIDAGRAVSHFRMGALKKHIPAATLAAADGLAQVPGAAWKLAPSVFLKCTRQEHETGAPGPAGPAVETAAACRLDGILRCPLCDGRQWRELTDALVCRNCSAEWPIDDGIYDFRAPRHTPGNL